MKLIMRHRRRRRWPQTETETEIERSAGNKWPEIGVSWKQHYPISSRLPAIKAADPNWATAAGHLFSAHFSSISLSTAASTSACTWRLQVAARRAQRDHKDASSTASWPRYPGHASSSTSGSSRTSLDLDKLRAWSSQLHAGGSKFPADHSELHKRCSGRP